MKKIILCVYGSGGHKAQMNSLLDKIKSNTNKLEFIGICENINIIESLSKNYTVEPLRDKYSHFKTFVKLIFFLPNYIKTIYSINKTYNIKAVISTGPGIAIITAIFFKILKKKIIFLETYSRFKTKSLTGRIMYKIADKFYIQNKSLQKYYPKAIYGGML